MTLDEFPFTWEQAEIQELRRKFLELQEISNEMVKALNWYASDVGGSVKEPAAATLDKWQHFIEGKKWQTTDQ